MTLSRISNGTLRLKTDNVAKFLGGMYGNTYDTSNKNATKELITNINLPPSFNPFTLIYYLPVLKRNSFS